MLAAARPLPVRTRPTCYRKACHVSQYPDERSPQDEVPFSTITSPRGIPVDQLVSVLQKDIRRSNVDNAVLAAHEMLSTSAEVAAHYPSCIHTKAGREVGRGLRHWWENALHNQRVQLLKLLLLLKGNQRIIVVNIPWYL